jgi:putative exosortase-associated protein (TIGR04073 family)
MRGYAILFTFLLLLSLVAPGFAEETAKPENIMGKMAFKFTRGVTNVATSVVEIPKQSYLTIRDEGAVGLVIGPIKGLGMTIYRTFIGAVETAFFLVPQPGYYDPTIDPDFVWNGWEDRPNNYERSGEVGSREPVAYEKGE